MLDRFTRSLIPLGSGRRRSPSRPARLGLLLVMLALAGCGAAKDPAHPASGKGASAQGSGSSQGSGAPVPHPQVVEPDAGVQAQAATPSDPATPTGDVNAHAPPLATVKRELRLELVYAPVSSASYIDPLRYVTVWERTDQGVDAQLPVGAPILAPSTVKILAIIPDWYAGQPLVYWELLAGPDAGRVQYVAEQITNVAPAGTYVQQGQPIARFARSGTGIEYGWSTPNGTTLAVATSGYEEGEVTPAGRSMRAWLNSLGAHAGNG